VIVASLNTRGVPVVGSRLAARYELIGAGFETGDADVVCVQEVFTYWHLGMLARRMPSFRHLVWRPSLAGPAGGLVTFSRLPVAGTAYRGFGVPPRVPGFSWPARLRAGVKGALVTRLAQPDVAVINTHPVANRDGDWSKAGRFYRLHRAQLAVLSRVVQGTAGPVVVCGDFNIDRESSLFSDFTRCAGLADVFAGGCPATFRPEYLPAGATPHCIDFILAGEGVRPESADVLFAARQALPGGPGYVSDHLGLSARLFLEPP
jgi:sphingomyelin phosphodiesterase 2